MHRKSERMMYILLKVTHFACVEYRLVKYISCLCSGLFRHFLALKICSPVLQWRVLHGRSWKWGEGGRYASFRK